MISVFYFPSIFSNFTTPMDISAYYYITLNLNILLPISSSKNVIWGLYGTKMHWKNVKIPKNLTVFINGKILNLFYAWPIRELFDFNKISNWANKIDYWPFQQGPAKIFTHLQSQTKLLPLLKGKKKLLKSGGELSLLSNKGGSRTDGGQD